MEVMEEQEVVGEGGGAVFAQPRVRGGERERKRERENITQLWFVINEGNRKCDLGG